MRSEAVRGYQCEERKAKCMRVYHSIALVFFSSWLSGLQQNIGSERKHHCQAGLLRCGARCNGSESYGVCFSPPINLNQPFLTSFLLSQLLSHDDCSQHVSPFADACLHYDEVHHILPVISSAFLWHYWSDACRIVQKLHPLTSFVLPDIFSSDLMSPFTFLHVYFSSASISNFSGRCLKKLSFRLRC